MKVVLIRHGQPEFETQRWVGVHDVRAMLQQYNDSRVTARPVNHLWIEDSAEAYYPMTSGLARAQDSARLCQNGEAEVSELLNEAELPHPDKLLFPVPWPFLIVICRLAWLVGYRSNASGRVIDSERARQASVLLINRALVHTNVCIFGHGIMNRLIARELAKRGWEIQSRTDHGYWNETILFFSAE